MLLQAFTSIVGDFGCKEKADLLSFVPMKCVVNLDFNSVEVVSPVHKSNWVSNAKSHSKGKKAGSRHNQWSSHAASTDINELLKSNAFQFVNLRKVKGSLHINHLEFMPPHIHNKYSFEGHDMELALHLPDNFPSKHILKSLAHSLKDVTSFDSRIKREANGGRDGTGQESRFCTFPDSDAVEYLQCKSVEASIDHKYSPTFYTDSGNVNGVNLNLPKRHPKLSISQLCLDADAQSQLGAGKLGITDELPRFMSESDPADILDVNVSFDQVVAVAYGSAMKHFHAFVMNVFANVPLKAFEKRSSSEKPQSTSRKRQRPSQSQTLFQNCRNDSFQQADDSNQVCIFYGFTFDCFWFLPITNKQKAKKSD